MISTTESNDPLRISKKESLILNLLIADGGEMYGLELVEKSNGCLARGTVYTTLIRMEEKGLVQSEQKERDSHTSGIPRRLYRPTSHGRRVNEAWDLARVHLANKA